MSDNNIYRMLTIDEAAELLSISEKHIRNLANEGQLPSWRPGPGTVRIPYWVWVWQVSKANGLSIEDLAKEVVAPVTMLASA